jgi:hypothetical protein
MTIAVAIAAAAATAARDGLRSLIDHYFPDLPFFGRDSTEAGARIMRHLGFVPFDNTPHLFWRCASVMEMAA